MLFLLGPGSHEEARKGTPNIAPVFFIYLCFPDLIGSSQSYLKACLCGLLLSFCYMSEEATEITLKAT